MKSFPKMMVPLVFILALMLVTPACAASVSAEKSLSVSPGGRLVMDLHPGSITVTTHAGNGLTVKLVDRSGDEDDPESLFDYHNVEISQSGSEVRVTSKSPRSSGFLGLFGLGHGANVHYEVSIPTHFDLDLTTRGGSIRVDDLDGILKARTSGGSLKFGHISGPIDADTSGGSIRVEGSGGPVKLHTSGGSIAIGQIDGSADINTSGGSITVREVNGDLRAETSGGSIRATITRQPTGECRLRTSGGSITVELPADVKLDVDAETSGGRVRTDFSVEGRKSKNWLRGQISGGGPLLYLRTSGGSILIQSQ